MLHRSINESSGSVFSLIIWNNLLVSGSHDCCLRLYSTGSWSCIDTLFGHLDTINDLAVLSDTNLLVSASGDGKIKIWDFKTRSCIKTVAAHEDGVCSIAFEPERDAEHMPAILATSGGSLDTKISIWTI